ncbi:MAG: beta-propeller domain-containing protein [bacterium]|nr:beta-propeller domain-containing protein [bacterium]MDE0287493.1 beta-propeller domain-containing protein [bacterium]MDE0437170.1 beta-propeller domain-containing protein [bacterium]
MRRHALCVAGLLAVINIAMASPSASQEMSPSELIRFEDCDAFLDHVKAESLARVGPYGLSGRDSYQPFDVAEAAAAAAEAAADASKGTTTPVAGVDYSATNVQEAGVDEPDIVKTDGTRIVALSRGVLYHIDVSGRDPAVVSTYDLWPWLNSLGGGWRLPDSQLFLRGDTVLVMMSGNSYGPGGTGEPKAEVVQFDLSEPVVMRVVTSLSIDGRLVSARLVDDRASLVVSSESRIDREFVYPASGFESARSRAERSNRNAIRESTLEHWVPGYELKTQGRSDRGSLVDCSATFAPQEFSGFGLLSVLNIDLSEGLRVGSVASVMAGGDTVYASTDRLYVANRRWIDRNDFDAADAARITTQIHSFDVSGPDGPVYEASGSVDGLLLNQFAMSEHDGYLRVASTNLPVWGWWRADGTSESRVDVLERDGGRLRVVGSVKGLGRGERIFAVRFIGEMGYVVTFRQIDPLYTVDLSDPTAPEVRGELKIPGYSAYLHPVGEDLVLGVGQDANEQGRIRGTQVSLFDVSDPAKPVRTHQYRLPRSSRTEVEFNHRAFLYWPQTGLAVLPIGWWGYQEGSNEWVSYQGAVALRIGSGGIERLGTIEHELDEDDLGGGSGYYRWTQAPIRRSLVIGDNLFTLSDAGLKGSDLASLVETSWTRFAPRPTPYVY